MKKISFLVFILSLVAILTTSCLCPPVQQVTRRVPVQPRPQAQPQAQPEAPANVCDVCSLIRVTASAPREAVIGQNYESSVNVTAIQDAGDVKITSRIPANLTYVRSEPPAVVDGNRLTWDLGNLNRGDTRNIKIWWVAGQEGRHWVCYVAYAFPRYCVETLVGRPALAITKTGPATVNLNGDLTYTVVVTNTGTAMANNVVVTDEIPDGLVHASGQKVVTFDAGNLAPKASRTFSVAVKAVSRGQFCNRAIARSANAGEVNATACTNVLKRDVVTSLTCQPEAMVGDRANVVMRVQNTGDTALTGAVVELEVPATLRVVQSDCATTAVGTKQVWNIGNLQAGATVTCNAVVMSQVEGRQCVVMAFRTTEGLTGRQECCTVWKGVARIEITKTAPARARVGEEFTYNIVVRNAGTGLARDVRVSDVLPPQVSNPRGADLQYTIGDLAPGQSRTVQIPVRATTPGNACNVAKATGSNVQPVEANACTLITQPAAQLTLQCPSEEIIVGRRITSTIVFRNTGDVPLSNIVITANWTRMTITSSDGNPTLGPTQAVWNIPTLEPRADRTLNLSIIFRQPGRECIQVTGVTAEGINVRTECCIVWKGMPALLLEVIDTEDPLGLGEETTYVIEVTNQGTADDQNIKIVANFPPETNPIVAQGDTKGTIEGKRVNFMPYPILQPKQKIKWIIRTSAVGRGDSRLKVALSSNLLQNPVEEEESTQVY